MSLLEFVEKWHIKDRNYVSLQHIGFSSNGSWIAVGGDNTLFILEADGGKLRIVLRNEKSVFATLQWMACEPAVLVCSFTNGEIFTLNLSLMIVSIWSSP